MKNTKVIIVDDEPIVRAGLENWLSRDYQVISFESAESFLKAYEEFEFEDGLDTCLLLDFQMTGMNGVELQNALREINADFPIIFMSGNAQQRDIIDAWHGGAVDFILKPFSPNQITDTLEKQFTRISELRANIPKTPSSPSSNISITKREAEVLILLAKGLHQSEVAQTLGISIRTVKMYRSFLRDKIGLNTLAELGRYYENNQGALKKIADPDQTRI